MIRSHLIRGHISAFQRAQVCPNRFSHLRGKDVSLMEVGLKITFPVISPEPKVATIIQIYLIYDHTTAFERAQDCPNQFSHLREKDVSLMEHISGYISGTESRYHDSFTLDMWPQIKC